MRAALLVWPAIFAPQDAPRGTADRHVPSRAYERPGLHHVGFVGTVAAKDGAPAAGVRLILFESADDPLRPRFPLRETASDSVGAFRFDDVESDGPLELRALAPEGGAWRFRLEGAAGELATLGEIRLEGVYGPTLGVGANAIDVEVRGEDGTPVGGARVALGSGRDLSARLAMNSAGTTDGEGAVRLYGDARRDAVHAWIGNREAGLRGSAGNAWIQITVSGARASSFTGAPDHAAVEVAEPRPPWSFRPWSPPRGALLQEELLARVASPGRVPRLIARLNGGAPFAWNGASDEPWSAQVTSGGKPVADAWIDVETAGSSWGVGAQGHEPIPLGTLRTARDGRLDLLGPPHDVVVATVIAPGYEPKRVVWSADRPLRVDLAARDLELTFRGLDPAERLVVRRRGSDAPLPTRRLLATGERRAWLAPGEYDVLALLADGAPSRAQAIRVVRDPRPAFVSMIDRRARRVVVLPPPSAGRRWFARAGRAPLGSNSAQDADEERAREPASVAQVEIRDGEAEFCFPAFGRYCIEVGEDRGAVVYSRMINIRPGTLEEVPFPALDAAVDLRALGPARPGADPRVFLASDPGEAARSGWDATLFPGAAASGVIPRLPSGPVFVTSSESGDRAALWCAAPMMLIGGRTIAPACADADDAGVLAIVTRANGLPCAGGVLRIRSPLAERIAAHVARTGKGRMIQITGPSAALFGAPVVLSGAGAGRIECVVEMDDGERFECTRDLAPKLGLMLRLPR